MSGKERPDTGLEVFEVHNKIRKETHPSLVGERNCASYDVVVVVDSGQFPVTDRVG